MEDPRMIAETLSISTSGRKRSSVSSSPEFEFWMIRNPSFPQPNLLSADELFADGVLLPLHHPRPLPHLLPPNPSDDPPDSDPTHNPDPDPAPGPQISASSSSSPPELSTSKRWRDIFKKSDKKISEDKEREMKKKERSKSGGGGPSPAELNINLWPFSRSRSAGTGGARPRMAAGAVGGSGTRKVSSAPCSRSNSAGESKSRKWPSSPGRPGVHLGRTSPVWQVRRGGSGGARRSEPPVRNATAAKSVNREAVVKGVNKDAEAASGGVAGGARTRVLNLNVPMCIGYTHHMSCSRGGGNGAVGAVGGDGCSRRGQMGAGSAVAGDGGRGSNFFNLRGLFARKVY